MTHSGFALFLAITITALTCAIGYILGRSRPWDRLVDAALDAYDARLPWYRRIPIGTFLTIALITHPVRTVQLWRHRHDPAPRSPYGLSVISTDGVNHLKGDQS